MNCTVCGSNGWLNSVLIKTPDMYEKWMGITDVKKRWRKCLGCGLWHNYRNYPLKNIEGIYKDGYRNPEFRGETIKNAFDRIICLPDNESENATRVRWLLNTIPIPGAILDIGAGLGLFPFEMHKRDVDVHCVDINSDSIEFIKSLGMECTEDIPYRKFDLVSLIHLLEHIERPVEFLADIHKHLKPGGKLFIEVPDAIEFELLFPTHDDFNSCHTHFYDVPALFKVLGRADYNVIDIHREHYIERNTRRIMAICQRT